MSRKATNHVVWVICGSHPQGLKGQGMHSKWWLRQSHRCHIQACGAQTVSTLPMPIIGECKAHTELLNRYHQFPALIRRPHKYNKLGAI